MSKDLTAANTAHVATTCTVLTLLSSCSTLFQPIQSFGSDWEKWNESVSLSASLLLSALLEIFSWKKKKGFSYKLIIFLVEHILESERACTVQFAVVVEIDVEYNHVILLVLPVSTFVNQLLNNVSITKVLSKAT